MKTASQILRYGCVFVLMGVLLGAALLVAPFSARASRSLIRTWSRAALAIFGVSFQVHYTCGAAEPVEGGILAGLTQQSLLEPLLGYASWLRPVQIIWNWEFAVIPFLGWVSFLTGWVIVRQRPAQAHRQLARASRHAGKGGLVYVSVEGQRAPDGRLGPYKKGPVVMAIEAQVPIHPVYIVGSGDCMPHGAWQIRPGTVMLRYLAPIPTAGMTYADRDVLLARLRAVGEEEHARWQQAERPIDGKIASGPV